MKKVLLAGELNEIVRSLNECLADDFFVQLCSEEFTNIQAMVRITKPDLIIICQIGVEEIDNAIFTWLKEKCSEIRFLASLQMTVGNNAGIFIKVNSLMYCFAGGKNRTAEKMS